MPLKASPAVRGSVFPLTRPLSIGKTRPMHAVVATVSIKDAEVAREALAGARLSLVPRAPGFVSAYWLEPIDKVRQPMPSSRG